MANEKRLTEKDKILLSAIAEFIKENGYPPSVRELCRITGKSSTGTIQARIKSLKQKGYITTMDNGKRTIRITKGIENDNAVEAVPVVHGRWIHASNKPGVWIGMKCSLCGARIKYSEFTNGNHKYCHKCGSCMMDGDGNG